MHQRMRGNFYNDYFHNDSKISTQVFGFKEYDVADVMY